MYISAVSAHNDAMSEMTVTDARARLADVVDSARVRHDPVYLTRRGRRVAAVIDADDLDRLIEAAEDLADIEAARAAREEIDVDGAIPWEQVKADLGMAMGTGTDVAMESADIVLVHADLESVPRAIALSRATLDVIKQNLAWAFGYNIAAIPLAMAGLLNPMIAGAAMALSSVLVVLNSLRLRRAVED